MKSSGIVRRIDNLGRITIAREIIKTFGWRVRQGNVKGTAIEMYVEDGMVALQEYKEGNKFNGIVRHIDNLNRLVIPREIINSKEWKLKDDYIDGTPLEAFIDNGKILLKEYQPGCVFCGEMKDITTYKGKNICQHCLDELSK